MIAKLISALFTAETLFGRVFKIIFFLFGLVIMPFGAIVWVLLIRHGLKLNVKRSAASTAAKLGISRDLYIEGAEVGAIVDKAQQKVLFVSVYNHSLYPFSEILGWEWQWVDKNGSKRDNKIVFKLRDENSPIVKVGILSAEEAEQWHNRLDLIINKA